MYRVVCLLLVMVVWTLGASAQNIVADVLSGKLVHPEVGQWAWYVVTDGATKEKYLIRQAIVGEEKVNRKRGFWLEIEVVPQVGFPTIYKMLLTGPASKSRNIHRVLFKEGNQLAREIPTNPDDPDGPVPKARRKSLGMEKVKTFKGKMDAEHYTMTVEGRTLEVWLNDAVRPMGVVRMSSSDGELVLRDYGVGGEDGQSKILGRDMELQPPGRIRVKVDVLEQRDDSDKGN